MTVIHSYREVQFSAVILLKLICSLCMCLHILANHPRKLTLCPAILETFKIVPEIIHERIVLSTSLTVTEC